MTADVSWSYSMIDDIVLKYFQSSMIDDIVVSKCIQKNMGLIMETLWSMRCSMNSEFQSILFKLYSVLCEFKTRKYNVYEWLGIQSIIQE